LGNLLSALGAIREVRNITRTRHRRQRAFGERSQFIGIKVFRRHRPSGAGHVTPKKQVNLFVVSCHSPKN
jgi:hypothetical protein